MLETYEIRRQNILALIQKHESQMAFARAAGLNGGHMRQLINPTEDGAPRRTCGEKLARKIEQKLKLKPGWLDARHPVKEAS